MSTKIIAGLFYSLDGVVESPDQWQFDAFGPEEGATMSELVSNATEMVIGRTLWQEWSEFWPQAGGPFGEWVNPVRKHVLSSQHSGDLDWNSTVIDGDVETYIRDLKESTSGDIVVSGVEAVRSLFLASLIDELTLTTHPVIAGHGKKLFDAETPITRLQLLRTTGTPAGNVISTYALKDTNG